MSLSEKITDDNEIKALKERIEYLEEKTGYSKAKHDEYQIILLSQQLKFPDFWRLVDDRSVQQIFREINEQVLAAVLYSLQTKEEVDKFRRNVSKNHFTRLVEAIRDGWMRGGVGEFMEVVDMLEQMGEIVVGRDPGVESIEGFWDTSKSYEGRNAEELKVYWDKQREEREKADQDRLAKIKEWKDKVGIGE